MGLYKLSLLPCITGVAFCRPCHPREILLLIFFRLYTSCRLLVLRGIYVYIYTHSLFSPFYPCRFSFVSTHMPVPFCWICRRQWETAYLGRAPWNRSPFIRRFGNRLQMPPVPPPLKLTGFLVKRVVSRWDSARETRVLLYSMVVRRKISFCAIQRIDQKIVVTVIEKFRGRCPRRRYIRKEDRKSCKAIYKCVSQFILRVFTVYYCSDWRATT